MYSFENSLHDHRKVGTRDYVFRSFQVTVCGLHSDSEVIEDCTKLFTSQKDGSRITTRYCFWEDVLRGVRSVEPKDIIGIGGKITLTRQKSVCRAHMKMRRATTSIFQLPTTCRHNAHLAQKLVQIVALIQSSLPTCVIVLSQSMNQAR
jgi:hypothetical protein